MKVLYSAGTVVVDGGLHVVPFVQYSPNQYPKPVRFLASMVILATQGMTTAGYMALYVPGSNDPGAKYALFSMATYTKFEPAVPIEFDFANSLQIMVEYSGLTPGALVRASIGGDWA